MDQIRTTRDPERRKRILFLVGIYLILTRDRQKQAKKHKKIKENIFTHESDDDKKEQL